MSRKTIGAIILLIIAVVIFVPVASSSQANGANIVVTYGETTYNNANYKNMVDSYFNVYDAKETVITASDVNKISSGISNKKYNSNQIYSCAMVDLSSSNNIRIEVDSSKITTVTPSMYKSALDSAGISKGSNNSKKNTVATISRAKLLEIAQMKMPDLNAYTVEAAANIVEGTARNMGIVVEK